MVEPATEFVAGWHLDAICEHLQAVTRGEIRNLLINVPPRHAKSLCVSVFWMVWSWLNKPESRWLYSSYAQGLATRDSLKCRRIIESPWFQCWWGDRFALCGDQNLKMRFENDKTGYRLATSVGGSNTGEGADFIVADDPHNVQEAESEAKVSDTLSWWDEVMSTRLNNPKTGAKVIVMQRAADKDLSGHVLEQGGYEHLCLPAEYEPARRCITGTGWSDPRQSAGDLLWPARIGAKEIADFKLRLGPTGYAGQFQQTPTPSGGGRFKQAWFRYFKDAGEFYALVNPLDGSIRSVRKNECDHFPVLDPASAEKTVNTRPCYSAMPTIAVTPTGDMLITSMYRDQAGAPELADAVVSIVHNNDLEWVGVESNGIGLPLIQNLRKRGIAVHMIPAKGSKEARSETLEIRMCAGTVYFRQGAAWLFELEKELLLFPNGEYCDQVDALSHGARHVERRRGAVTSASEELHHRDKAETAEALASGISLDAAASDTDPDLIEWQSQQTFG